jgi:AcrR family transcriptional regulator
MNIDMIVPMPEHVKPPRRYRSARRAERAGQTRSMILAAAREAFLSSGYSTATVGGIAAAAGVHVDTVYASIGRKPDLIRAVVESAISGTDHPVPAEARDYVRRIKQAGSPSEMIEIYAGAVASMAPRTAPVFAALRTAGLTDPDCAALYSEISGRRAANMRRFAADLRAAGGVRTDLDDAQIGDLVWATNSEDYYRLLVVDRGWALEAFRAHLADLWRRMLLD